MPLDWKLLIVLAAVLVVAAGAAVVALLYGIRRLYRAVSAWADRRVEREVAAGLNRQWHVWDDEAEAGMDELQVQMLREGYVMLPEDLRGEPMCPMLPPADGCTCGPCTAARIEQVRQESPSAEVYELTEREWADHIAAYPLDGRPFGIARYVPQQRDGGDL